MTYRDIEQSKVPIMIIKIILGIVFVAGPAYTWMNLAFAQEDKTQDCQRRDADIFSRLEQWLAKRQSAMGQLDLDGSLKADLISIGSDMRQVGHDCKDIIDLSQPPPGYAMEDFKRLADAVNTELCKMGVQCAPVG
jgi:hypothetical protein